MTDKRWMTDVLIDLARFAQQNNMPDSAKAISKVFAVVAREIADGLPVHETQEPESHIVQFLPLIAENSAKGS